MSKKKLTKADILKDNLIEALEKSLGVVTSACKNVGCSRETFYKYYRQDEEFARRVDSLEDYTLDFVESQLHKQIKEGNTTSIIFYLKTKGKKRGYIERQELTGAEGEQLERAVIILPSNGTELDETKNPKE